MKLVQTKIRRLQMTKHQLPITGHCLCGDIQFEITQEPLRAGLCHCRSCQIKSGADHIAYIAVAKEAVNIQGESSWFQAVGGSGQSKKHGFCSRCGSNLFGKPQHWPHILVVYIGALDKPNDFKPEVNIWMQDALTWSCIDKNLENFEKNPL